MRKDAIVNETHTILTRRLKHFYVHKNVKEDLVIVEPKVYQDGDTEVTIADPVSKFQKEMGPFLKKSRILKGCKNQNNNFVYKAQIGKNTILYSLINDHLVIEPTFSIVL